MIRARTDAARRAEVRAAARAWRDAGAIDEATLTRIDAAYPDDRPHMAAAWKVLVFVVVTVAVNALVLAVVEGVGAAGGWAGLCFVFAVFLSWATELLLHGTRVGENGSAAATSFWAVGFGVAGAALAVATGSRNGERAVTIALLAATLLFAAACWRWGYAVYGAFAAAGFFFLLARLPFGRLAWLFAGAAVLASVPSLPHRRWLAPPFRRAATGLLIVAAAAVYVAVNRYSLDRRVVESMREGSAVTEQPGPVLAAACSLATALFPAILILWGLRSRRTLPLDLGLVVAALSLVTLRYYVHLAPLWILLTTAGAALVLAALALDRWLRRGPAGERGGFTARPLFESRGRGLETAAVVAAFAPDAAPAPARDPGGFTPGGGRYGGGGAEGSF